MKSLERLIETWKGEGVALLPPPEESHVVATLDALGKPYSADVVKVFCLSGGMVNSMDLRLLSLWSLDRVRKESDAGQAAADIAFADFLIESFWYDFHFEDSARSSVYGGYERRKLAESVEEFFALCLDDPERLDLSVT
jgi:hypothetical protein